MLAEPSGVMSSHLVSDWAGPPPASAQLEQFIEGPLQQIEAARKALHSPSLVSSRASVVTRQQPAGGSMRQYSDMAAKQPGRKCLSRTQMAEPYELSQDLLDKQLEMLGSRYGGLNAATDAANTIQRAYRRYIMMKKFAAITSAAQVKNENRLSKRFQGQAVVMKAVQHTVRHVSHDTVDSSGLALHSSHHSSHHPCGGVAGKADLARHFTTGNCQPGHHPAHPWPQHTPHHHIGVRPGLSLEDDSHSDAEIQSFPIDYLPDRSALACSRSGQARLLPGRSLGPSHAHCANCGSGQALPSHHNHRNSGKSRRAAAPDVPKRTVSRLTSLDVGESSELYPRQDQRVTLSAPHSRNSSSHSSPRVRPGQPSPASQNNIPSRPKDVYHSNYAVNEVIRKRHYRTGLNIFNKKPERGIQYLIGKGFLDNSPSAVARFLMTRKGLAKQMIGEYLGNISSPFNQSILHAFANEMDFSNMPIDLALRKFQTYFR